MAEFASIVHLLHHNFHIFPYPYHTTLFPFVQLLFFKQALAENHRGYNEKFYVAIRDNNVLYVCNQKPIPLAIANALIKYNSMHVGVFAIRESTAYALAGYLGHRVTGHNNDRYKDPGQSLESRSKSVQTVRKCLIAGQLGKPLQKMISCVVADRFLLKSPLADAIQVNRYTLLIRKLGTEIVALTLQISTL